MSEDANVAMHPTAVTIRKSVTVEASVETSFATFTAGLDTWWPREYNVSESPLKKAIIEPEVGGRCYNLQEDGSENTWGRVLVWEPPSRFVFAWQLTSAWQYDANFATEVEVTFAAQGPERTLVTLEHRDLERYGDATDAMVAALDSEGGWTGSVALFKEAAEGRPQR